MPKFCDGFAAAAEGASAEACNAAQRCVVAGQGGGAGVIVDAWPNTSLYAANTVIPAVRYDTRPAPAN